MLPLPPTDPRVAELLHQLLKPAPTPLRPDGVAHGSASPSELHDLTRRLDASSSSALSALSRLTWTVTDAFHAAVLDALARRDRAEADLHALQADLTRALHHEEERRQGRG